MQRVLAFGAFGYAEHAGYEARVYLHIGHPSGDLEILEHGQVIWQQDLGLGEISLFVAAAHRGQSAFVETYLAEVELNIKAARAARIKDRTDHVPTTDGAGRSAGDTDDGQGPGRRD